MNNVAKDNVTDMNVNSDKRVRRTPEEARALILSTAARRLSEYGLDGLSISGVAKEAGISHATIIHHFGSTGAMRAALLQQMTAQLLSDVVEALHEDESPDEILGRLFTMLSRDGHGRLLAWLALDRQQLEPGGNETAALFQNIIDTIAGDTPDRTDARLQVLLVATAAMGLSICGDPLASLIGLSEAETDRFPGWLADRLQTLKSDQA